MKSMTKLFAVVLGALLLFSIVACTAEAPVAAQTPAAAAPAAPAPAGPAPAETEKPADALAGEGMVFGLAFNNVDDYQTRNIKYITEAAEKMGATIVTTDARGNVEKQISDIESLITREVDCIWFAALDPNGLVPAVDKALAAGIPIVEGGYGINSDKCFSLGTRQANNGKLQYDYVAKYLDANPDAHLNICYLWGYGPTKSGDKARHDTFFELLEKNYSGRYTVLAEEYAEYNVEKAIAIAEDWTIAFPDMNCLISQSDEMACGVINILKSHNLDMDKIIICGIDSSRNLSEPYFQDGSLDMSTFTDLKKIASVRVETMIKMAKGELKMTENMYVDEAQNLVTAENCDEVWKRME